jgi:hypothetical protein
MSQVFLIATPYEEDLCSTVPVLHNTNRPVHRRGSICSIQRRTDKGSEVQVQTAVDKMDLKIPMNNAYLEKLTLDDTSSFGMNDSGLTKRVSQGNCQKHAGEHVAWETRAMLNETFWWKNAKEAIPAKH